jgi:hypothetical protein
LTRLFPALRRFFAPVSKITTRWAGKHPRLAKFLTYAAGPTAAGAAMTLGELPFRRRQRIIQILPAPDYMQTQFRGM